MPGFTTLAAFESTQMLFIAKHPLVKLIPFANVELAVVDDVLRIPAVIPPTNVEVAVVVEIREPTVRADEVEVIDVPSNHSRLRLGIVVELVPPRAIETVLRLNEVPLYVSPVPAVVVDTHVGTPLTRARV